MTFAPKKPTHHLKAGRKEGSRRTAVVGRAWDNGDGSFSIQMNACCTISDRDDVFLTLFPIGQIYEPKKPDPDM